MIRGAESAASYLAAMIDGEGTVSLPSGKSSTRCIRIANTEPDIIAAVVRCCRILEIKCATYETAPARPGWRKRWDVTISGKESLQQVLAMVPIQSRRKLYRLKELIKRYRISNRPPDADLLHMYIERRMSYVDILKVTGAKSTGTVSYWLRQARIAARDYSAAASNHWGTKRVHAAT